MNSAITLNDVCEFIVDSEHKTAPTQETGYPYIRTPNIGRGRLDFNNVRRVGEATYIGWTKRAVPVSGDLILAREAPVGNVAIVPDDEKVCLGQRTVLLRPNRNLVDPEYLNYLLIGDEVQSKMHSMSSGATVAHLNMKDIRELVLPKLPLIDEQKKLAKIISSYDNLIENNNRRIAVLENMAQSLYREWFVNFRFPGHENTKFIDSPLGKIPGGWEVLTLKDVLELAYGKALKKGDRNGGDVAVYGSGGLIGHHNQSLAKGPCILVGRKGNVGSVFWSEKDVWPIDTVYYVKPRISVYYLYYNLVGQTFHNSDAAVPGLNRESAYSNKLIVPDSAYLDGFENFVVHIFRLLNRLRLKNENLKSQRDLLLPKLISGSILLSD